MNLKLNLKQCAALSALTIAASAALAADTTSVERTRADVVAETIAARTAGQLAPAGERGLEGISAVESRTARSERNRADVAAEVRAARASGQLLAAGETAEFRAAPPPVTTALARDAVKAEVLAARAAGALVPAGEGPYAEGSSWARADVAGAPTSRMAGLRAQRAGGIASSR